MAGPVLETFTGNAVDNATSITLTKPTGVVSGDLLLLIVGDDNAGQSDHSFSAISGWTLDEDLSGAGGNTTSAVYWREADGTEGASEAPDNGKSTEKVGWYLRISGADTTTPFDVKGVLTTGSGTEHIIPEVTTTVADCLALYYLMFDGGDGDPFSVAGTGWSQTDEQAEGTGNAISGCIGEKDQASAAATGDATVTSNVSDDSCGIIFAIAPAAGGAPSGTGSPALGAISVSAIGGMQPEATGAPLLASVAVAAVGAQILIGTGTPELAEAEATAVGVQSFVGTTAPLLEPLAVTALGLQTFLGDGAPELETALVEAVGNSGALPVGTGTPLLESALAVATGAAGAPEGAGAPLLALQEIAAAGLLVPAGAGSPLLENVVAVAAGSAGEPQGAATPLLALQEIAAGGLLLPAGTGAPLLADISAAAVAVQIVAAAGAPALESLFAAAAGALEFPGAAAPLLQSLAAAAAAEQILIATAAPELAATELEALGVGPAVGTAILALQPIQVAAVAGLQGFPLHRVGALRIGVLPAAALRQGRLGGNAVWIGILKPRP